MMPAQTSHKGNLKMSYSLYNLTRSQYLAAVDSPRGEPYDIALISEADITSSAYHVVWDKKEASTPDAFYLTVSAWNASIIPGATDAYGNTAVQLAGDTYLPALEFIYSDFDRQILLSSGPMYLSSTDSADDRVYLVMGGTDVWELRSVDGSPLPVNPDFPLLK